MKPVIIYILEVLACSGVLLAAYAILLERRVKFRWCRLYLLLTTFAAALIPLLRIPVWPGRSVVAAVTAPAVPGRMGEVLPDEGGGFAVTPESICLGLYLLGAALIAGVMVWQVVRIRRLRRGAEVSRADGYTLVRTRQEIASFSFLRTIYIWDKTPAGELAAILAHESSHIAHRHSIERILMELMKAFLWWNPFVWIAARRLTETEEFEADSDVLNSGYDRAEYMQTIFRQLFGYSPEIANGLRNSLTKKRFKMMTMQTKSRHGLLRLAGTLPAVIGLLCAFGFTARAAATVAPATVPATAATQEPTDIRAAADATENQDTTCKRALTMPDENEQPVEEAPVQALGTPKGTATGQEGRAVPTFPAGAEDIEPATPAKYEVTDIAEQTGENAITVRSGNPEREEAFLVTETMPLFPTDDPAVPYGDLGNFRAWVQKNVKYPVEALNKGIGGRVVLTFVVEKDGSVSDIEKLQSPDASLWEEARRVIASSPKWKPGEQRGQVVRVKYTLPVDFRLTKASDTPAPESGK